MASVHNDNIEAIYNAGVTSGCVPRAEYCPNAVVTREDLTATYNTTLKRYEIEIAGEYYTFRTHPTIITPNSFNRTLVSANADGKLAVYVNDPAGNLTQSALQIVIFKP